MSAGRSAISLIDLEGLRIVGDRQIESGCCAAAGNDTFVADGGKGKVVFLTLDELRDKRNPLAKIFSTVWPGVSKKASHRPDMRTQLLQEIEARYSFQLPDEYKRLLFTGLFDEQDRAWLPDIEWMRLVDILKFEPDPACVSGLIPFASHDTGLWMWAPEKTTDSGTPIVYGSRNSASFYSAPSFSALVYRQVMEYAGTEYAGTSREAVAQIKKWDKIFGPIWPEEYKRRIKGILGSQKAPDAGAFSGIITWEECQEIIRHDLDYADLDAEFAWYKPGT